MSNKYYLPDTLKNWKWPRQISPDHVEVRAASAEWLRSLKAFSPRAQDAFDRCEFSKSQDHPFLTSSWAQLLPGLLACMTYPFHDKARLRTGCDFMNMVFVFDEYTDRATAEEAQVYADIAMDALRNPHVPRPKGEWIGGEVTRHQLRRFLKRACKQAADRNRGHIRNIEEYIEARRETIGGAPAFALVELGMNLPDEAVNHPVIEELSMLATDMIWVANVGEEDRRSRAMDWVGEHHKKLEARFMKIYENDIPKFGEPVDSELAQYVDGFAIWVRGNDQWNFESGRYFGSKAQEIQKTRCATLLPKARAEDYDVGPQHVDDSKL
ncbi:isoprenoid synthase domain-containing protein [Multifurca ochricompacta]|uniref:Isoprenoid synthase domain-containing protein n=1 Tax=Multifurca ochricompacta TaxID=376703 RepID=A0AAD4LZG2_9AGAM|nr:isoprenoid synthase domain-containing protein [Multifurca ochricompacta]